MATVGGPPLDVEQPELHEIAGVSVEGRGLGASRLGDLGAAGLEAVVLAVVAHARLVAHRQVDGERRGALPARPPGLNDPDREPLLPTKGPAPTILHGATPTVPRPAHGERLPAGSGSSPKPGSSLDDERLRDPRREPRTRTP